MFKIILAILVAFVSVPGVAKTEVIKNPMPVSQNEKAEVIEFFSYNCPHCYRFGPSLENWLKSHPDIVLKRIPVAFNSSWVPSQKLYYTLGELKVSLAIQNSVFKTIHDDHILLNSDDAVISWAVKNGFDKNGFAKVYNSKLVQGRVDAAQKLAERYDLQAVPALVVNGKYMVYQDDLTVDAFLSEVYSLSSKK